MRVTVIGAGIMGLSAAWALARCGHQVALYERGPVPNPHGSSADQHRLIRHPYGAQAGYTRMVTEAYGAWDELWADLGQRLYVPTGTLVLASGTESWARDSAVCLEGLGIAVSWLEPREVERRFPLLATPDVTCAFHLETGGVLLAESILEAMAGHLAGRGVRVSASCPVVEMDPDRARVWLADGRVVDSDALVVAAGVWASRLVPGLSDRVTPSRQVVAYVEPPPEAAAPWAASPMILDIALDTGFYLVPPVLRTHLKVGDHRFTLAGDPDAERDPGEHEARALLDRCRHRFRGFDRYRLAGARVCFYSVEPRERFILEATGSTWVMSACSGHGFKFGPVLGLGLAEAIEGRRGADDLARWAAGEGATDTRRP